MTTTKKFFFFHHFYSSSKKNLVISEQNEKNGITKDTKLSWKNGKKKELDSKIRSLCQRGQNGHCEETFLFSESRQLVAIEYEKGCSTIREYIYIMKFMKILDFFFIWNGCFYRCCCRRRHCSNNKYFW